MPYAMGASRPTGKASAWRQLRKTLHSRVMTIANALSRSPLLSACLIICVFTSAIPIISRLRSSSLSNIHDTQTTTTTTVRVHDDSLLEQRPVPSILHLDNLTSTEDGLFALAILQTQRRALVHLQKARVGTSSEGNHLDRSSTAHPSLFLLAQALNVSSVVAPSFDVSVPLPIATDVVKHRVARVIYTSLGFRSRGHIPSGAFVVASVYPAPDITESAPTVYDALEMPAHEPYTWRLSFPTASECRAQENGWKSCCFVQNALMVVAIAGCNVPGNSHFIMNAQHAIQMGIPIGCFQNDSSLEISFAENVVMDVWKQYVRSTCKVPRDFRDLLEKLFDLGWGVGKRARGIASWLDAEQETEEGKRSVCDQSGLSFYPDSR